jgi:hypothetical protein
VTATPAAPPTRAGRARPGWGRSALGGQIANLPSRSPGPGGLDGVISKPSNARQRVSSDASDLETAHMESGSPHWASDKSQMDSDPRRLYHGTLLRNVPSIRDSGLQPQRGSWATRFHPDAAALVYAVDEEHKSRAMLAVGGQVARVGLIQRSENYSFEVFKNDLVQHGAVIVVKAAPFRRYPGFFESGHPIGAEPFDWYSSEPVRVESEVVGEAMLAWLAPSEEDFVYRFRNHFWGP